MIKKIAKGALALALALGMAGCTNGANTPTDSPIANLPNPMVSVESADAFSAAGVNIDAPADATDVSYYIISGTLAGVEFTYDGEEYTYRASAKDDNISGIYYELTAQYVIKVECDGFSVDATVYAAEDKGTLVEWEHDGTHYALWHAGDTDEEKLTAALTGVMARTFGGVQNDPAPSPIDFSKDGECEADLDGDGTAERISIYTQSGEQYMLQDYCTLSVKDASGNEHTMNLQIQWATIAMAYDFDADGKTELFISGDMESDDFVSYVIRFDGSKLVLAAPETPYDESDLVPAETDPAVPQTEQPSFYGSIETVNDGSLTVNNTLDILGTRGGSTTYLMDADEFRFAKDPSAPWVFKFDTNNAEDWEYMGMETSAEFPVRMDGTQEDATLPIGTEIAITEISLDGEEYVCRFVTRAGEEGTIRVTFVNTDEDYGCYINGVSEYDCFKVLHYAG